MKESMKMKLYGITAALVLILVATIGIMAQSLANSKRETSIANANIRALTDTVQVYQSEASNAAARLQLQQVINSDSIAELNTALGEATRDKDLTHVALTDATVEIDRLQTSLDEAVTELSNVTNPEGRPERIAAFQFDTTFVQTDVVVVVPWDTSQSIEVELVTTYKPIPFTYALSCTPEYDAVATFESPTGILIRPQLGTVDPFVCHPRPTSFTATLFKPDLGKALWAGLGFGAAWWLNGSSTVDVNIQPHRSALSIFTVRF